MVLVRIEEEYKKKNITSLLIYLILPRSCESTTIVTHTEWVDDDLKWRIGEAQIYRTSSNIHLRNYKKLKKKN